jgi:hypothetical protein
VVEGARLESVYTGNCIASSNLAVSAQKNKARYMRVLLCLGVALLPLFDFVACGILFFLFKYWSI